MSKQIQHLIQQLIDTARAQGISQAQLAQQAGMTPVGLSKAKTRGDLKASTLAELANQLNLDITLVPRRTSAQAADAIRAGRFFQTSTSVEKKGK